MSVTREKIVKCARSYIGVKYGFQGCSRLTGMDCGQFPLQVGRDLNITALEFLGYADNPDGETYERLLDENLIRLPELEGATKPNPWNAGPGDILSFDLGEGVQHMSIITNWDGRRFTVVHSLRNYGVIEAPLFGAYIHAKKQAYRVQGVVD